MAEWTGLYAKPCKPLILFDFLQFTLQKSATTFATTCGGPADASCEYKRSSAPKAAISRKNSDSFHTAAWCASSLSLKLLRLTTHRAQFLPHGARRGGMVALAANTANQSWQEKSSLQANIFLDILIPPSYHRITWARESTR